MKETAHWVSPKNLRQLFVTLMIFCQVANPKQLFEMHWEAMAEDIKYKMKQLLDVEAYSMLSEDLRNHLLVAVEELLKKRGSLLLDTVLPLPLFISLNLHENQLIGEELSYDQATI